MKELLAAVDACYKQGDGAGAEKLLRDALITTTSPQARVTIYSELGGLYRTLSRYDESELAYERAIELLGVLGSSYALAKATAQMNLAGTYRMRGDVRSALELFLQVKSELEAGGNKNTAEYAATLNNLALAYSADNRIDDAIHSAKAALAALEAMGAGKRSTAIANGNVAGLLVSAGEDDAAKEYIDKAIAIFETLEGKDGHYPSSLTTRATLLWRRGERAKAVKDLEKAAEITLFYYGKNADWALNTANLARMKNAVGDYDEACALMEEAIETYSKIFDSDDRRTSSLRAELESWR